MGGSKLSDRCPPVNFHLGGNFSDEIQTSHFPPFVVLPLVHGVFSLLHSPDNS
jgi:hypothetical protein